MNESVRKVAGGLIIVATVVLLLAIIPVFLWLALLLPRALAAAIALILTLVPFMTCATKFMPRGKIRIYLHRLGTPLFAIFAYLTATVAGAAGVYLLLRLLGLLPGGYMEKHFIQIGFAVAGVTGLFLLWGFVNGLFLRVTRYSLTTHKPLPTGKLRVVLLSDIHLGVTTGRRCVGELVRAINSLEPDIVLIAGDLFDEELSGLKHRGAVRETFLRIQSRLGVYACMGNHDYINLSKEKQSYIRALGITVLEDCTVTLDGFTLTGRKDASVEGRASEFSITQGLSKAQYHILLDHQPNQIGALLSSGIDLLLCGHTHGGQSFPANLFFRLWFTLTYGHKEYASRHAIVTSGAGNWGMPMRVGTRREIVCIDIKQTTQTA